MVVAFSSEEQRIYIKFKSYRRKNAREIHIALQEVCSNSSLAYSHYARCANQFRSGRESVKDSEG